MTTMPIQPNNKFFWEGYVKTAQDEAAHFLKANPNKELRLKAIQTGFIHGAYRPIVFNYTDKSWNWDWSRYTNTYIPPMTSKSEGKKEEKEEEEEKRAKHAKLMGTIAFIAGAFLTGFGYKAASRQYRTLSYTQKVQRSLLDKIPNTPTAINYINYNLLNLVSHQLKVDQLNTDRISNYFYSALGLLLSGAFLLAGGFGKKNWAITAGYITAITSAAFAALNLGLHWNDRYEITQHYQVIVGNSSHQTNGLADLVLIQLQLLDDHMQPLHTATPPPYQSIYPELYQENWSFPTSSRLDSYQQQMN